jgi:hypothetical protein
MFDQSLPPKITYRDFRIEFTEPKDSPGTYQVRAVEIPDHDPMRSDEAEPVPFTAGELDKSIARLERRRLKTDDLIAFGEALGNLLLPGKIGQLFRSSLDRLKPGEGLRLRLAIEPLALAALPWEYALVQRAPGELTANDFLCLRPEISITRYENAGQKLDPIGAVDKFKLVAALANPDASQQGLADLDIEQDRRAVQAAVDKLNEGDEFINAIYLNPATRDGLEKAIPGAQIFHFGGHGVFDGVDVLPDGSFLKKGKILLEDPEGDPDFYDSTTLASLLAPGAGGEGVRLAVLGACNGATRDAGGSWTGVAPALVKEKIPAVVAMQFKVGDQAAIGFMLVFYALVLDGYPVDQAVSEARRQIYRNPGSQGDWATIRDWGTPVLYLRSPDGILFPEPKELTMETGPDGQPVVNAQVKARRVAGRLTNVDIGEMVAGIVNASLEIDEIAENAEVTNVTIESLGGRRKDV